MTGTCVVLSNSLAWMCVQLSVALACTSGTQTACTHAELVESKNTLTRLKVMSKILGNTEFKLDIGVKYFFNLFKDPLTTGSANSY